MAATVALTQSDGTLVDSRDALTPVRDRINQGLEHRRRNFEGVWQSSLAFAAGKQWLVWDRDIRALRRIQDVDARYRGTELYQADIITEYRTTALGELSSDDDRPQLLLARDDEMAEEYQAQANRALAYAWDHEVHADEALEECDSLMLDLGTAAIRCRYDGTAGPVRQPDVPHQNGQPILDLEQARAYVADQQAAGRSANLGPINRGQTVWEPLSAFNLVVPPGISNERYFPWECVVRPTLLVDVQDTYGAAAAGLKEDGDIGSILGMETSSSRGGEVYATAESRQTRLRDHVWLYTYYERPSPKFKNGRVLVFASKQMRLLKQYDQLPYIGPDGIYRSGLTYFHWWRVTGRFWSRGLVESLKDGQRTLNKRRTQQNEIIDRGMPFVLIGENSKMRKRTGSPVELIEVPQAERQPIPVQGIAPGQWMQADVEAIREDVEHATGIRGPRLGENPANITTYSQLALVSENERTKREPIVRSRQRSIKRLVEDTIYDMRTYWGSQKELQLAGDDEQAQAEVFNAAKLPTFFIVKIASGAAQPRTQAAELKLIEDVAQYSVQAQVPVPVTWFKESLEAGQPLELPQQGADDQTQKAMIENHLMFQGELVPVAYYDPPNVHIPLHRNAQVQAELSGQEPVVQLIEQHIQAHLQAAQANAAQVAQTAGGATASPPPGLPPGPLSGPPPPPLGGPTPPPAAPTGAPPAPGAPAPVPS
jgi:hypothetical protein